MVKEAEDSDKSILKLGPPRPWQKPRSILIDLLKSQTKF